MLDNNRQTKSLQVKRVYVIMVPTNTGMKIGLMHIFFSQPVKPIFN